MIRKIRLPNLGCDYIGHYEKNGELVIEYARRPGMHCQAIRELEIDVPEDAPAKIKYQRLNRNEETNILAKQILQDLPNIPQPTKEELARLDYLKEPLIEALKKAAEIDKKRK